MKVRRLPAEYIVTGDDEKKYIVGFIPVTGCPGFTHKVHIRVHGGEQLTVRPYWLSATHSPCGKSAIFFVKKHLGMV